MVETGGPPIAPEAMVGRAGRQNGERIADTASSRLAGDAESKFRCTFAVR
jgi:hypothetical protein